MRRITKADREQIERVVHAVDLLLNGFAAQSGDVRFGFVLGVVRIGTEGSSEGAAYSNMKGDSCMTLLRDLLDARINNE